MNARVGTIAGRRVKAYALIACALLLAGCGDPMMPPRAVADTTSDEYVVMGDDLAALRRDFNAAIDQVRLVFIVGPT